MKYLNLVALIMCVIVAVAGAFMNQLPLVAGGSFGAGMNLIPVITQIEGREEEEDEIEMY